MQNLQFPGPDGRVIQAGFDVPADRDPVATALFIHRLGRSTNTAAVDHFTRALASDGIATLRLEWVDEVDADASTAGGVGSVEDVVRAAEFLARAFTAPVLLLGHSTGGTAVLAAEAAIPSARAVVTIGAPFSADQAPTVAHRALPDLNAERMSHALEHLRGGLLIMHGPADATVSIDHAARLFQAARHPKSFISLDQSDHLLSSPADARFAASVIAAWARQHVETSEVQYETHPPSDNRIVAVTGREGFRTEVMANGHPIMADEPHSVGGTNTGPTPYNLLAAALAACTSMTLRMYADRKEWPLEEARVTVTHTKIHASDCRACEEETGRIDHLYREVELEGPLDVAQRKRLLEIANRCPVHRTLEGEIQIETAAAGEP